jgi:hypothetical protein
MDGPACTDEALNNLLFRATTGLGFKQKDIILTASEFANVRKRYEADPTAWLTQGLNRYQSILDSVPPELLPGLDERWFRHQFKKGPPNIKSWESEDLPGVIGVYYYQSCL